MAETNTEADMWRDAACLLPGGRPHGLNEVHVQAGSRLSRLKSVLHQLQQRLPPLRLRDGRRHLQTENSTQHPIYVTFGMLVGWPQRSTLPALRSTVRPDWLCCPAGPTITP